MKKKQRWAYLGLIFIPLPGGGTPSLCSFCKYAQWHGTGCGDDNYRTCSHPLADKGLFDTIVRMDEDLGEGDCWGFRPDVHIPTADGMVQNWIQGKDVIYDPH